MKFIFVYVIVFASVCLCNGFSITTNFNANFYFTETTTCPDSLYDTDCKQYLESIVSNTCSSIHNSSRYEGGRKFILQTCGATCPPNYEERRDSSKSYPGCCPTCVEKSIDTIKKYDVGTIFNTKNKVCPDNLSDAECYKHLTKGATGNCSKIIENGRYNNERNFEVQSCYADCHSSYYRVWDYSEPYPYCCPFCIEPKSTERSFKAYLPQTYRFVDYGYCRGRNLMQCKRHAKMGSQSSCMYLSFGVKLHNDREFIRYSCSATCPPTFEEHANYSKYYPDCCPTCVAKLMSAPNNDVPRDFSEPYPNCCRTYV